MTLERKQMSIATVKDNIKILESQEPDDAGYYLQLEHEKLVLEALEKQIPMQHHHTRIDEIHDKARISVCPSCLGCIITRKDEYPKFCTWCGQALDWSDEGKTFFHGVCCKKCSAKVYDYATKASAKRAWNRRVKQNENYI